MRIGLAWLGWLGSLACLWRFARGRLARGRLARARLLIDPQPLELGDRILGALAVVIGHVKREFPQRNAVIPTLLAYVGEVRHLRQAPDQLVA